MANTYESVIERWKQLPSDYPEVKLEKHFIDECIWPSLGLNFTQIESQIKIGAGLKPDYLIFSDDDQKKPLITIEVKKRDQVLAESADEFFIDKCKENKYYQESVGYQTDGNGIQQYLNKENVDADKLPPYGLVMNGDFFQLWKRIDGLVMPMTDIQRMTEKTIPALMKQLDYCLNNPYRALVTAVWNQKGGVAKTTNTINIGAELALAGKRVLLIDLDSQNDLTRGLGLIPDKYNNWLLECVKYISQRKNTNARKILNSVIQHRIFPTSEKEKIEIDILPIGKYALDEFRESKGKYQGFSPAKIFPRIISFLTPSFDYIFIDTSPAADQLTRSLMYSIDSLLIPIDYGKKSIYHGVRIHKKIKEVRESRKKVNTLHLGPWNLGLVYSNCPADAGKRLDQMIDQELDKHFFSGKRYKEVIRTFAQAKVAEFKHMPVVCWRQSQITKCYQELVKEVFINPNFINE